MKITYDWIKDFLEVRQTPQKLAEKLTMAGLSVESLTPAGKDWVFDIEVTSNRPDCLSVRGLLREIAAVTNAKTKKNKFGDTHLIMSRQKEKRIRCASPISLSIRVDDKKGCRLYCGHLITGVKIGPSP
jgi:phenylalanyl-tRNA synthetase beta chain